MPETEVGVDALDLLKIDDVARKLKVSTRTAWRLVNDGHIQKLRVGARVRFTRAALAAYIEAQQTAETEPAAAAS